MSYTENNCERSREVETEHEVEENEEKATGWLHDVTLLQGLAGPSSITTCSSLSTSCHLIPNPFIHSSVFTNHCLNSLQAVVKRWFKSSQCIGSMNSKLQRALWVRSPLPSNCLWQRERDCACKLRSLWGPSFWSQHQLLCVGTDNWTTVLFYVSCITNKCNIKSDI